MHLSGQKLSPSWVATGLRALLFALLVNVPPAIALPGDDLLALPMSGGSLTQAAFGDRFNAFIKHLQQPELQSVRVSAQALRIIHVREYFEATELSNAILLGAKKIKIDFATNVYLVAGGDVNIAHASGVSVFSPGNVEISHLTPAKEGLVNLIVAKGKVTVSHLTGATVYAINGLTFSQGTEILAVNTDLLSSNQGSIVRKANSAPAFKGEPVRVGRVPAGTIVNSGSGMGFSGQPCNPKQYGGTVPEEWLSAARKEANCFKVDAASVACESRANDALAPYVDAWKFNLCGKAIEAKYSNKGIFSTFNFINIPGRQAPGLGPMPSAAMMPAKNCASAGPNEPNVNLLINDALAAPNRQNYSRQIELYSKALSLQPCNWIALNNRASAKASIGDIKGSLDDFDSAVEYSPSARGARASIRARRGDQAGALEDFAFMIGERREEDFWRVNRGFALMGFGHWTQAITDFSIALQRSNKDHHAYEGRALAYLIEGSTQAAFSDAFSSIEIPSANGQFHLVPRLGMRAFAAYLALISEGEDIQAQAWLSDWRTKLPETDPWRSLFFHTATSNDRILESTTPRIQAELFAMAGLRLYFLGQQNAASKLFNNSIAATAEYGSFRSIALWGLERISSRKLPGKDSP